MANTFKISVNAKQVIYGLRTLSKATGLLPQDVGREICEDIKKNANRRLEEERMHSKGVFHNTTHIENSWKIRTSAKKGATLFNSSVHASMVEFGTGFWGKGSAIEPNGSWMMFPEPADWVEYNTPNVFVRNGMVFLKYSKGQPPKFFFSNGIKDTIDSGKWQEIARKEYAKYVAALGK